MKNARKLRSTKITAAVTMIALVLVTQVLAQAPSGSQSSVTAAEVERTLTSLSLGKIFTYLMVMVGPIKLLVPYVTITKGMEQADARGLAIRGFAVACVAGIVAAVIGQNVLKSWQIGLPALLTAAGLILLLVALQAVLAQYQPRPAAPAPSDAPPAKPSLLGALSPLAFPNIITPYGTAAFILLLAAAAPGNAWQIFAVFVAVMLINLIAMIYARPIVKYGIGVLSVLGSVLGVLQVALAVEMLLAAGRMVGLLPSFLG